MIGEMPGRFSIDAKSQGEPLTGSGELLRMRFKVLFGDGKDILNHAGSVLEFDSLVSSVNRGSVLARYYDGYVTVSGDCLWPLSANENYVIFNNQPNPFNPSTLLTYELRRSGHVSIQIYDHAGRYIRTLLDEQREAGSYSIHFHAAELASGRYQALLLLDGYPAALRRLLLLR